MLLKVVLVMRDRSGAAVQKASPDARLGAECLCPALRKQPGLRSVGIIPPVASWTPSVLWTCQQPFYNDISKVFYFTWY